MSHERQDSGNPDPDSRIHELEKTEADYQILRRSAMRILHKSPLYHGPPSLTDSGIVQGLSDTLGIPSPYIAEEESYYAAKEKLEKERERYEELKDPSQKTTEIENPDII